MKEEPTAFCVVAGAAFLLSAGLKRFHPPTGHRWSKRRSESKRKGGQSLTAPPPITGKQVRASRPLCQKRKIRIYNDFTVIALQDPPAVPRAWSVFAALSQFFSAPVGSSCARLLYAVFCPLGHKKNNFLYIYIIIPLFLYSLILIYSFIFHINYN